MMDENKLDQALGVWGGAPFAPEDAVARIIAHAEGEAVPGRAVAPSAGRRWWAWGAGGALAAGLALTLLWVQPMAAGPEPADDAVVVASAAPDASFAMLYSTTEEEEMSL